MNATRREITIENALPEILVMAGILGELYAVCQAPFSIRRYWLYQADGRTFLAPLQPERQP